jgi:hypothetical protein
VGLYQWVYVVVGHAVLMGLTMSERLKGMVNGTGISAPNALPRGRGSLVSFLHVELVVVAGTSLG